MTSEDSLTPRLYFDEDAHGQLAKALRRDGIDVETTAEAGRLEASDEQQLEYAVLRRRTLVTHNVRHFPAVHAAWLQANRHHYGIVVLVGTGSVGTLLRRMRALLAQLDAVAIRDQLIVLGSEFDA